MRHVSSALAVCLLLGAGAFAQSPPGTDGGVHAEVIQLQQQGRYQEAIPIAERILAEVEQAAGENGAELATALNYVALLHEASGDYARAEPHYQRLLELQERRLGAQAPEVASAASQLAHLYVANGELARAEPLYERALAIHEKHSGKQSIETAAALNSLAKVYDARGDYSRAEPLYRRALAIREQAGGGDDPEVATILVNWAALRYSVGDYQAAEPLYQRALAIDEKALGEDSPDVAKTLNNLALLYQKLGDYQRAEALDQRALAIIEKKLGVSDPAIGGILSSLASIYETRGEYAVAEPLLRRALAVSERAHGVDHPKVASVLNNLAMLYQSMGDSVEAERLYDRALAIREKALGPLHPDVAASLNNLAMLHEARGEYGLAEPLYRRAAAIYAGTLGEHHRDTEAVRANVAGLLLNQGQLDAAFEILRRGSWPTALGRFYLLKKDYYEAHSWFVQAVAGAKKSGESRHLLASYIGLGMALEGIAEPAEAAKNYRAAVELMEQQRSALPAAARVRFLSGQVGAGFQRILAYDGLVRASVKLGDVSAAMRWAEHTKARQLLEATAQSRTAPGLPPQLAEREEQATERLGALYRQAEVTAVDNPALFKEIVAQQIPQARSDLDALVDELRRRFPAYAGYKYPQPIAATDTALQQREVLVEYAVTADETFAWLVRDHQVVKSITIALGRAALAQRVREYRTLFQGIRRTSDLRSDGDLGRQLYDLLIRDLISECVAGETLIIVPDSSLALVPFEALIASAAGETEVRYLGDQYPIQYAQSATVLNNARRLPSAAEPQPEKMLVVADPVFDPSDKRWPSAPASSADSSAAYPSQRSRAVAEDTAGMPSLPRLARTEDLVDALQDEFGKRVRTLSGIAASEASFRNEPLADYRYLVFATHGALGGQLRYLQEPALILSQVGVDGVQSGNDGFLTLSEVMGLRLQAEVGALTACQTGVGKELDGEGVMGMGWAFAYAGARNVVMSLWSVDQRSTVELMESFFGHLRKGLRPQEALRQARRDLRDAGYQHPFFWAPFVLSGEG